MAYDFERGVPRTPEARATAHAELAEELASYPNVPPEARALLRMLEHFGGALNALQTPTLEQRVEAVTETGYQA
jgi:hypothetical protein